MTMMSANSTVPRVFELGRVRGRVEHRTLKSDPGAMGDANDGVVDDEDPKGSTTHVDRIPRVRIVGMSGALFFANSSVLKDLLTEGRQELDKHNHLYVHPPRPWVVGRDPWCRVHCR